MKTKLQLLVFLLFSMLGFSQILRPIAREINDYHAKKTVFKSIDIFSLDDNNKQNVYQKAARDLQVLKLDKSKLSKILSERPAAIEFTFPFENRELVVEMVRVDIYSPEFRIETSKSKIVDYKKGVFYRGIVKGDNKSVVAFSFFDNDIVGITSIPEIGNVTLGKAKNSEDFVVYNDQKLTGKNPFVCATDELMDKEKQKISFNPKLSKAPKETNACVRIYYEICYNAFLQNESSVINTVNWISAVQNNVNTLYINDGVKMSLKSLFIWETPDPYIGQSSNYLTAFNAYRPNFDGDLAHLINTPSTTSYANLDSLCESYKYAYSGVNITYADVPTYSWTTFVLAHEMGHSLGSPHTHSCAWNGDMTPIDWCGPTAMPQIITNENLECALAGLPENGGTIMSYCHLLADIGINLSKGFGEQPAALIRETINSKSCLGTDCIDACKSTITFFSVENVLKNSVTINFSDTSTNTQWKYKVSQMDGTIVFSDTTTEKNFTVNNLLPGTFYIVEIGVVCSSTYQFSKMIFTDNDWCGKTITDSGGINANYTDGENWYKILYPDNENQKIKITFQEFDLQQSKDFLYVRNGPSVDSPFFAGGNNMTGTFIRGPFESTHPSGAITLIFKSDLTINRPGFKALLSCTTLGVDDINDSNNLKLFPNPVKNQFTINNVGKIISVKIFDKSGKIIKDFDNASISKNTFDVSKLKTGNYIVTIKTDKETISKTIIKE